MAAGVLPTIRIFPSFAVLLPSAAGQLPVFADGPYGGAPPNVSSWGDRLAFFAARRISATAAATLSCAFRAAVWRVGPDSLAEILVGMWVTRTVTAFAPFAVSSTLSASSGSRSGRLRS